LRDLRYISAPGYVGVCDGSRWLSLSGGYDLDARAYAEQMVSRSSPADLGARPNRRVTGRLLAIGTGIHTNRGGLDQVRLRELLLMMYRQSARHRAARQSSQGRADAACPQPRNPRLGVCRLAHVLQPDGRQLHSATVRAASQSAFRTKARSRRPNQQRSARQQSRRPCRVRS
jgi:hypothetical protein